jgi:multidrug efflux pump subunit AcrA (membrane-fusion protein)
MMELRLLAEPDRLTIGEAVTVALPEGGPKQVLSIPRDALVLRNEQSFVYVISPDDTAVKIPVVTGAGYEDTIAVTGELQAGSRVVIRGAERLREGQKVKIIQHHLAGY